MSPSTYDEANMYPIPRMRTPKHKRSFCTDCTIYVSVYGYKRGGYSLVASQGLTRLQEGFPQQGTVGGGDEKQYYEFFNPPGRSQSIQVCLTGPVVEQQPRGCASGFVVAVVVGR